MANPETKNRRILKTVVGGQTCQNWHVHKKCRAYSARYLHRYYSIILYFSQVQGMPYLACLLSFVWLRYTDRVDRMKTPNQLSREAIDEFKAIYQEEFGEILSDDEVQEIAMRLLRFFGILNK